MRIRIESDGKLPFWLAGNPSLNPRTEQSEVLNEQVQITRSQQEVTGSDWEVKQFEDRGNQGVVYIASVKWQFTDTWAAMDFIAALAPNDAAQRLHEWSGNVWLREDKEGTDEYKEWLLPKAVVSLASAVRNAVRVEVSYRISAGGFGGTGTGTSTLVNLVANSAGFNGVRITPAMILAALEEAPAGLSLGTYGAVYVTPRGADTLFANTLFLGLATSGMTPAERTAVITGNFVSQISATVSAINALFDAPVVSGGVESGDWVIRQPADAVLDDIQIYISTFFDPGTGSEAYYLAWVNLLIEPDGIVNLTASHLGTDYQLTALHS